MTLYELVLEQRYYNQQVINRFNYWGTGTPAAVTGSFALLSAFGALAVITNLVDTTPAGAIQLMQSPFVDFVQCTARAVYIDEDFYGNPFVADTQGLNPDSTNSMSPVSAFGFRSNRVKQSIGRGYKRFVGVTEGSVDAGGEMSSSAITAMNLVVAQLGATLTYDDEGNTLSFAPCIAQKEKYTTDSGKEAYKYYASEALQTPHLAIGINWEPYSQMRTQNTRQYGRGS